MTTLHKQFVLGTYVCGECNANEAIIPRIGTLPVDTRTCKYCGGEHQCWRSAVISSDGSSVWVDTKCYTS